jgi:hypothetical protein
MHGPRAICWDGCKAYLLLGRELTLQKYAGIIFCDLAKKTALSQAGSRANESDQQRYCGGRSCPFPEISIGPLFLLRHATQAMTP